PPTAPSPCPNNARPGSRYVGGAFVVLFHLALIYLFATSLGYSIVPHVPPPFHASVIDAPKPTEPPPTIAEPPLIRAVVPIPPDTDIVIDPSTRTDSITTATS